MRQSRAIVAKIGERARGAKSNRDSNRAPLAPSSSYSSIQHHRNSSSSSSSRGKQTAAEESSNIIHTNDACSGTIERSEQSERAGCAAIVCSMDDDASRKSDDIARKKR